MQNQTTIGASRVLMLSRTRFVTYHVIVHVDVSLNAGLCASVEVNDRACATRTRNAYIRLGRGLRVRVAGWSA